jgi:hypothetical protein
MRRQALGLLLCTAVWPAAAQSGFRGDFGRGPGRGAPEVVLAANLPYTGLFEFTRIRYAAAGGLSRGGVMWSHDYARAEANFTRILAELTSVRARTDASAVLGFDDPALFDHTIAYVVEVGYWIPGEAEVAALSHWLRRGGLLLVDDFSRQQWFNFEAQMRRVMPDARLMEIPHDHPVFDAFYHFTDFDQVRHPYDGTPTQFWGIFEDNDVAKRLMVIANYDGDIAEYWEFSDQGFFPIALSNEAYKLGVNYIVYGLTR